KAHCGRIKHSHPIVDPLRLPSVVVAEVDISVLSQDKPISEECWVEAGSECLHHCGYVGRDEGILPARLVGWRRATAARRERLESEPRPQRQTPQPGWSGVVAHIGSFVEIVCMTSPDIE